MIALAIVILLNIAVWTYLLRDRWLPLDPGVYTLAASRLEEGWHKFACDAIRDSTYKIAKKTECVTDINQRAERHIRAFGRRFKPRGLTYDVAWWGQHDRQTRINALREMATIAYDKNKKWRKYAISRKSEHYVP